MKIGYLYCICDYIHTICGRNNFVVPFCSFVSWEDKQWIKRSKHIWWKFYIISPLGITDIARLLQTSLAKRYLSTYSFLLTFLVFPFTGKIRILLATRTKSLYPHKPSFSLTSNIYIYSQLYNFKYTRTN